MVTSTTRLLHIATVEEVEKHFDTSAKTELERNSLGRRIKVKLDSDKNTISTTSLPWVFPLLPKHLQITPKVGEKVFVLFEDLNSPEANRFYIGPIISQDYFLSHGGAYRAMSLIQGVGTTALCHPQGNSANDGTIPPSDTIALQGRGNSTLWLKDEELRLMCGHKPDWRKSPITEIADPGSLRFNKNSIGYIQMRFGKFLTNPKTSPAIRKHFESAINLVADRINILTHDGVAKDSNIIVNDQKDLIPQASLEYITGNAQRMVYGDKLISFLNTFVNVFKNHTHHWIPDPQVIEEKDYENFWSKNLEDELLSKTIRIM